jgi:hypothetical protein
MLPNPYTPSGRPRVFVGREDERRRLRDRLARVVAYGEMMGPLAVATGPRGLGKTSLLRDMQAQAQESGFVVAWVSGVKHQPFLADVVDRVTRALDRAGHLAKPGRDNRIQEVGVEVGIGLAKVSAKITRNEDPAGGSPALVGPVEDFFHRASNLVREAGGAGLLLIIDELHAPLQSRREREYDPDPRAVLDAAVLLNAVQNMEGDREDYPLGVMGAGLPETKAFLTRAATFGERTHEFVLRELDQATARAVLIEPARQLGVTWDHAALDAAVTAGGGYPQSLQIIGAATWDAAEPAEGDPLTLADLDGGRAASEADIASLFQARWDVATDAEKALLLAMARRTDSEIERGAVAAEMGVDTEALGMTRRSLISKGIIEAPRRGVLRFTIPGFAAYVRAQDDRLLELPAADSSLPALGAPDGRTPESRATGSDESPRRGPAR